ncbi:endonuclease/exonuclease/phosphatase family protein [Paracoccus sp. TK19116]|uniref:Endonuclease/exonuclease/phosphatase family protein n=1 Tax=Paracoccus albicereus TaxID=2922394 RepID=A0ABT1MRZ5_9RHOB|nr:endonuclease/exonuclease/phosphatase family protein [Paracoccus albicereus]MCQ0971068.1 endonuclease/exonuclease/phosphatase family protein [Paracoccus albicereus]
MGLTRAALAVTLALILPVAALAETIRIATYSPDLTRRGPGLLLRDILSGDDPQIAAAAEVIAHVEPDVILLTGFDWDLEGRALDAFASLLATDGLDMPHRFAAQPNSGMATDADLDGDGRTGTPRDSQGYGEFTGQEGMPVMSGLPLGEVTDYSATLWRDLPDALIPEGGAPDIQRLSTTAHWDVPVQVGAQALHLLAWSATPPVFDGPEDRNGRRNHDEAVFWLDHLPADAPWVLVGNSNLDPEDGEGRRDAIARLLTVAQDPRPAGEWQPPQSGANATHRGDPARDTADWDDEDGDPGNMRVDLILPAQGLEVAGSGVVWPDPETKLGAAVATASRHRLVWVDLALP